MVRRGGPGVNYSEMAGEDDSDEREDSYSESEGDDDDEDYGSQRKSPAKRTSSGVARGRKRGTGRGRGRGRPTKGPRSKISKSASRWENKSTIQYTSLTYTCQMTPPCPSG